MASTGLQSVQGFTDDYLQKLVFTKVSGAFTAVGGSGGEPMKSFKS
jgi:hypothetical protein